MCATLRCAGHPVLAVPSVRAGELELSEPQREWVSKLYAAEVSFVDDNVGRILQTLRDLGLYDEALIVLTSDHGEEFWEHGGYEHGHTLYDELLRVPLILKLPGSSTTANVRSCASRNAAINASWPSLVDTTHRLCR